MIISHEHEFIYIKTHKTASTSTEVALSAMCGPRDIITPLSSEGEHKRRQLGGIGPRNYEDSYWNYSLEDWARLAWKGTKRRRFWNHIPCQLVRERVGDSVWDRYFTFTLERNSFDKVVSYYFYYHKNFLGVEMESAPDFADFVESDRILKVQDWELYARGDQVLVDHVGIYSNLEQELSRVAHRIGLPRTPDLPRTLHTIREGRDYRELHTPATARRVREVFHREVGHFGFSL